jgi:hypothetical protein
VPSIPRRKSFGKTSCVYFPLNHFTIPSFEYSDTKLWVGRKYGGGKECPVWWAHEKNQAAGTAAAPSVLPAPPTSCALNAEPKWEERRWQSLEADADRRKESGQEQAAPGEGPGFMFEGAQTIAVVGFNHVRRQPLYTSDEEDEFTDLISNTIKEEQGNEKVHKAVKQGLWTNTVTQAFAGLAAAGKGIDGKSSGGDDGAESNAVAGEGGILSSVSSDGEGGAAGISFTNTDGASNDRGKDSAGGGSVDSGPEPVDVYSVTSSLDSGQAQGEEEEKEKGVGGGGQSDQQQQLRTASTGSTVGAGGGVAGDGCISKKELAYLCSTNPVPTGYDAKGATRGILFVCVGIHAWLVLACWY